MMENFGKKFGNKLRTAVALGAAAAFSGGALEASQFDIAKAQTAVTMAELKLKNANSPKDKIKAEEALTLAKARVEEAKAKDADEKAVKEDGTTVSFSKDNSVKKVVGEEVEVDIIKDGQVIGKKKLVTGTKEYVKYQKDMAKIDAQKAKYSNPNVNYDYNGTFTTPDGRIIYDGHAGNGRVPDVGPENHPYNPNPPVWRMGSGNSSPESPKK
jgi:hypothetical protein